MAKDIVDVALGEVGYAETGENKTKYGQWMGMNGQPWCHMFVSWCAEQAGETSAVPRTASCSDGSSWFHNRGRLKARGTYTPKRGDIIYFGTGAHVGIVEKSDGGMVYTVEGNSSNRVSRNSYSLGDGKISGYGVPQYTNLNDNSFNKGDSSNKKKTSKNELTYLRRILKKKAPRLIRLEEWNVKETHRQSTGRAVVLVKNGKKEFFVPVLDGMKVTWERKGMPGKLTFETKYDKTYKIIHSDSHRAPARHCQSW